MRKVSYSCDRCGKPLKPKFVMKMNISIQKGTESVDKKPYDFCCPCYLFIKSVFTDALKVTESADEQVQQIEQDNMMLNASDNFKTEQTQVIKDAEEISETEQKQVIKDAEKKNEIVGEIIGEPKRRCISTKLSIEQAFRESGNSGEFKTGLITKEEHDEILRLYVEEGMTWDVISIKLNRLPRGIKRTINTAIKSGEVDRLRNKFEKQKEVKSAAAVKCTDTGVIKSSTNSIPKEPAVPILSESAEEAEDASDNTGSGVSNGGVKHDSYTAPPQKEVINGKSYDVGGVLALAKAGWSYDAIADERHYDKDIVIFIVEKYMHS